MPTANYIGSILGESPYLSRANLPNDLIDDFGDNSPMSDLTKEFILKVIDDGINRHGGIITEYEKAAGLNRQAVKDIRRSKKCPPADIWQKIAREADLNNRFPKLTETNPLNHVISEVNLATDAIIDRMALLERKIDNLSVPHSPKKKA